jgi:DNA-binding transcriptional regulator YiaG
VSAAEIARVIRVSRAAVSDWETGRRVPTDEHALAYGRLLAVLVSMPPAGG